MKNKVKLICILLIVSIIGCTSYKILASNFNEGEKIYKYEDVEDVVIRFHVLANSDTEEDQNLKLKVRDSILNYLQPYLEDSGSIEEARQIMLDKEDEIKEISLKVIRENGYDYDVNTELARENFPEKSYGNITLPQGEYEAFRVIIGNGEGHNWWCVMFPALCFIDVTKGKVEEDKSMKELDKAVEEKKEEENHDDIKVKFKIIEIFNKFFK